MTFLFEENELIAKSIPIVHLSDPARFSSWEKRGEHIKGLSYKYNFNANEIAAARAIRMYNQPIDPDHNKIECLSFSNNTGDTEIEEVLARLDVPKELIPLCFFLKNIWVNAVHRNSDRWKSSMEIRVDSYDQKVFHAHKRAITMSIIGRGTIIQGEGGIEEHEMATGEICLFEDIMHKSPYLDVSDTRNEPRRLNIAIY